MANRTLAFVGIAMFCLMLSMSYAWYSVVRSRASVTDRVLPEIDMSSVQTVDSVEAEAPRLADDIVSTGHDEAAPDVSARAAGEHGSVMFVRHTGLDRSYGVMAVERRGGSAARQATELRCDRIHFAFDRGVCLTTDRHYMTQSLIVFDEQFVERYRLHLSGLPSRARVSADGRLAATTVFVTGHSYSAGAFSTETSILDTRTGEHVIANLQVLPIYLNGSAIAAIDVNVWGVTFMPDSDAFYATVGTGAHTYLARGSVMERQMRVVRDDVECPSVSPDGRRIAFKKRVPGPPGVWRIHVMETAALEDWPVAETRSIDDQVEWIDADTLVYALPREGGPSAVTDLWSVPAGGSGQPTLVASDASSPAVVRAGAWARRVR